MRRCKIMDVDVEQMEPKENQSPEIEQETNSDAETNTPEEGLLGTSIDEPCPCPCPCEDE
jgi:hypothetical protein